MLILNFNVLRMLFFVILAKIQARIGVGSDF